MRRVSRGDKKFLIDISVYSYDRKLRTYTAHLPCNRRENKITNILSKSKTDTYLTSQRGAKVIIL